MLSCSACQRRSSNESMHDCQATSVYWPRSISRNCRTAPCPLVLTVNQGNVLVEAYDRMGRKLGDIPNNWTSNEFRSELENAFRQVILPDQNITTMVSNPMRVPSA